VFYTVTTANVDGFINTGKAESDQTPGKKRMNENSVPVLSQCPGVDKGLCRNRVDAARTQDVNYR
jgi:hypothetical protein